MIIGGIVLLLFFFAGFGYTMTADKWEICPNGVCGPQKAVFRRQYFAEIVAFAVGTIILLAS